MPLRTQFCDRLGIDVPIVLAGMGQAAAPFQLEARSGRYASVVALVDDGFDALVRRARMGNERAFAALVEPLLPKLRGYLRAMARDELDDLLDEVLFTVYRRLDTFDGSEAGFRSWVFAIAHNTAVDLYRKRRRRPEPVDTSDPRYVAVLGVLDGVDALVVDSVLEHRLCEVLDRLPAAQRRVLLLRTVADLSVEETAAVVGRSAGAVRVLHHRALAAVRRLIESPEPER